MKIPAYFISLLLMVLGTCLVSQAEEQSVSFLSTAVVRTYTANEQPVATGVEVMGTVRAFDRAAIAAKVTGVATEVTVDLGSRVNKGDLLVRISAQEIDARLNQAQARFRQAERNLSREQKLLNKQAATAQTVKSMQDEYSIARAAVEGARTMLGYATITAPFSGVITAKNIHAGDLATPGTVLLRMENDQRLQVICAVPESLVLAIHKGQTLAVTIPTAGLTIKGKVAQVAPSADPVSRTAPVTIDLAYHKNLRTGQFARVKLPAEDKTALFVPDSAVLPQGQMERIFVLEKDQARLRLVRTGMKQDGMTEIVSGLNPGETVIYQNNAHLVDGQPVKTE